MHKPLTVRHFYCIDDTVTIYDYKCLLTTALLKADFPLGDFFRAKRHAIVKIE